MNLIKFYNYEFLNYINWRGSRRSVDRFDNIPHAYNILNITTGSVPFHGGITQLF